MVQTADPPARTLQRFTNEFSVVVTTALDYRERESDDDDEHPFYLPADPQTFSKKTHENVL
jgi:hypothetical protein